MRKLLFISLLVLLSGCFFSHKSRSPHGHSHGRDAVDTLRENQRTLRRGHGVYRPQHQYPHMNQQFQNRYNMK